MYNIIDLIFLYCIMLLYLKLDFIFNNNYFTNNNNNNNNSNILGLIIRI